MWPISLTCFILRARCCEPWRPDAVVSTTQGAKNLSFGFTQAVGIQVFGHLESVTVSEHCASVTKVRVCVVVRR